MKTETFNHLLTRLKRDTSNTDLSMGMRSKWQSYELNVYCEDGGDVQIELHENENEVPLNGSQLEQISFLFDNELDQIEINIKNENAHGFTDDYESTGTKQSDFY